MKERQALYSFHGQYVIRQIRVAAIYFCPDNLPSRRPMLNIENHNHLVVYLRQSFSPQTDRLYMWYIGRSLRPRPSFLRLNSSLSCDECLDGKYVFPTDIPEYVLFSERILTEVDCLSFSLGRFCLTVELIELVRDNNEGKNKLTSSRDIFSGITDFK